MNARRREGGQGREVLVGDAGRLAVQSRANAHELVVDHGVVEGAVPDGDHPRRGLERGREGVQATGVGPLGQVYPVHRDSGDGDREIDDRVDGATQRGVEVGPLWSDAWTPLTELGR